MTTYRITLQETGPHRWTWQLSRVEADGHVSPMCHGMKRSRSEAEEEAKEWVEWHHKDRSVGATRASIDLEL